MGALPVASCRPLRGWGDPAGLRLWLSAAVLPPDFSLFSYNNGVVMPSCRELDSTRSALSAASAFAIATAGANEGTPTKEKYRRMSLASAGAGLGSAGSESACAHPLRVCLLPPAAPWLCRLHVAGGQTPCTCSTALGYLET